MMLAMMLVCLGSVRSEAIALIDAGRPLQAEAVLIRSADEPHHDLLMVARAQRGDAAALADVPWVLDHMSKGGVFAAAVEARLDRAQRMVWSVPPLVRSADEQSWIISALQKSMPDETDGGDCRRAIIAVLSGTLEGPVGDAPTAWRDAALAIAGDAMQRRGARHRLQRSDALPHELAWRLHVVGRSWLQEDTDGARRTGLVHLARIVADPELRAANGHLALHALDTLIDASGPHAEARDRLMAQRTQLLTSMEMKP